MAVAMEEPKAYRVWGPPPMIASAIEVTREGRKPWDLPHTKA
jgi:hypothetical protein